MTTTTLRAFDLFTGRVRGKLTVQDGQITEDSDRAMRQSAEAVMARRGVSAEDAVALLDGRNIGGRITWSTGTAERAPSWWRSPAQAERFDPHEPRDAHGRWTHGGGIKGRVINPDTGKPATFEDIIGKVRAEREHVPAFTGPLADKVKLTGRAMDLETRHQAIREYEEALGRIPAPMRERMAPMISEIDIGPEPGPGNSVSLSMHGIVLPTEDIGGCYGLGSKELWLNTGGNIDHALVAVHEGMHAWAEAAGRDLPSEDAHFKDLAENIWNRRDYVLDGEYMREGGYDHEARSEIFAQLAACRLLGRPLTLGNMGAMAKLGELKPGIAAEANNVLGHLGVAAGAAQASRAVPSPSPAGMCIAVAYKGRTRFVPVGADGRTVQWWRKPEG